MNLQTVRDMLPRYPAIPTTTMVTVDNLFGFSKGSLITFRTYDQSPLARFLKWVFNITPPTNHVTMRVVRIVGKSQLELEEFDA